jgi:Zn-dependent protease with chaperone function
MHTPVLLALLVAVAPVDGPGRVVLLAAGVLLAAALRPRVLGRSLVAGVRGSHQDVPRPDALWDATDRVAGSGPGPARLSRLPSPEAAAWLSGGHGAPHLVVTDGLADGPTDELEAVVAHELHHLRFRPARRANAYLAGADVVAGGIALALPMRALTPIVAVVAAWVVVQAALLLTIAAARREEFACDAAAAAAGHGPALQRVLSRLDDDVIELGRWSRSHPAVAERIARLQPPRPTA